MEKEFIAYEQALDLKELGFDEYCLSLYSYASKNTIDMQHVIHTCKASSKLKWMRVPTPLYQQAFRWFRQKFGITFYIESPYHKSFLWRYSIELNDLNNPFDNSDYYKTYEEAELECLKKLIELCKKV